MDLKTYINYAGHTIKNNGNVTLTVRFSYGELEDVTKSLCDMLSEDISISVKLNAQTILNLGKFRIHAINISKEGETTVRFTSISSEGFADIYNLNDLSAVAADLDVPRFKAILSTDE